jgi:hypothetical protein
MFIVTALVILAVVLSLGGTRKLLGSESLTVFVSVAAVLSALLWTGIAAA